MFWACQNVSSEPTLLPVTALTADVLASDKDFRDLTFLHNKITGQSMFLKKGASQSKVDAIKEMQNLAATTACLLASLLMVAECPPCALWFAIYCELTAGRIFQSCLDAATRAYEFNIIAECNGCLQQ